MEYWGCRFLGGREDRRGILALGLLMGGGWVDCYEVGSGIVDRG